MNHQNKTLKINLSIFFAISALVLGGFFATNFGQATSSGDASITVTRLFPGEYNNTKYSLALSDPDGLSKFEIKKSDGSIIWSGSPEGGTPPCPASIETGTITLNPSDFPLQGWVSDCLNSDTQYPIQASIPPLPGDVIINEFVSSPSVDGQEWYELLNTTDNEIGLTGSTIERAVPGDSITLSGNLPAHGILVFSVASNPANDEGDMVVLKNGSTDISAVSYGTISPEGVIHSSAPGIDESATLAAPSTWTVTGNPTKGWFNDAGQESAAPLLSTIDSSLSSTSITSNIGELGNPSATPTDEPDALYFEKSGEGKIVFTASLNLSDQTTVAVLQTLGTAMEMSGGHIAFDSETAEAMAATGAKIYMYGLDALGYESEPTIVVKNDADEIIDGTDIVSNIVYTPGGLNGGELSFGAAHFTQFDLPDPADIAAVAADKAALVDGLIQGDNANLASITSALAPLPSTGPASSSVITWASDSTTLVSNDGQTVTRPAFANGDATTTLTATITRGLATDTKVFNLTVLKLLENTPPSFDPIADQNINENSPQQEVLITNITPGDESDQILNIMAISSNPSIVPNPEVSGVGATRTLTYTPNTNGTAAITVTADDGGAENNTFSRTFSITVNPDPDIALLAADKSALTDDVIKGGNDDLAHIRENLTNPLPTSGSNGSMISWMSSEPARVSGDGTVTRPAFGEPDVLVTMTAQLSLGAQTDTKDFNVTVLAETTDPDIAAVAADKEALTEFLILNGNSSLDLITGSLSLSSYGDQGSTITWVSSNQNIVSNDGLTVVQPAFSDGDTAVTLTATITKGLATDTKVFNVTVLKLEVSADTTIISKTYSINTDEIDNETINNVPYGTSKDNFLAALTKNQSYQTWDSSDISDPVAEGDQLVVTAEDGTTFATYTVSALVLGAPTNLQITPSSPTNNTKPTLSWNPVAANPIVTDTEYIVEIYDSSGENIYPDTTITTSGVTYTIEDSLDDDNYSWQVRARNSVEYSDWSNAGNFTIDTVAPTVTKLGDDSADVILETGDTNLYFSEALSSSSQTAITNKLTAKADKALSYYWNENYILTITAGEITTFADDVTADAIDLTGNTTAGLMLIDSEELSVTNDTTGEAYATIQAAIDDADEGDIINVGSETYNENLEIDKALTLLGDPGDEGAGPAAEAPVIINASDNCDLIISIEANDVTVKGFVLEGNGECGSSVVKIDQGISGATISDNEIKNGGGKGVDLSGNSSLNLITNNIIHNNQSGIWIGNSKENTISDNKIYDNGMGVQLVDNGCDECSSDVSGNKITGNIIDNNNSSGIYVGDGYITFRELTISNNEITNNKNYYGIYFNGMTDSVVLVDKNTIDGNSTYGIYFTGEISNSTSTVSNNIITDNGSAGIYLNSSISGVTMTGNTIQNNGVRSETTGVVVLSVSGNKAYKNTISGNGSIEVSNEDENIENIFDAEQNWWGTASSTEIANKMNGLVDFTPWYINPSMTILSSAISGDTIDATTRDIDFKETSDGEVGLPSGTSVITMGNDSVLNFASSTNTAQGGNIVIAGVTTTLSTFALGDLTVVDLTLVQTIGGQAVTIEKAVKLVSGISGTPIVLTNTSSSNASVSIPDGTTIMAPSGWNGTIEPPKTGSASGTAPSGFSIGSTVISVGSPDVTLIFDTPVTLTLTGVTGPVGYKPAGVDSVWVQIMSTCAGTYSNPTSPIFPSECAITNGTDTKIVTYHFTTFGSLVTTETPSTVVVVVLGGGGGGGYYVSTPTPTPTITPTPTVGQVLGASAFRFTVTLQKGSKGDDVMELQNRLTAEGVYDGPKTGYFGPLTEAGVKAYQKKYSIDTAGVVGPVTMAKLNGSQVLGVSTSAETEAKITALKTQLASLLTQLLKLLQDQAASLRVR
ncbi:MAG: immunoglobulin-like domain-containing protein [Patescibacteria group bacterium]